MSSLLFKLGFNPIKEEPTGGRVIAATNVSTDRKFNYGGSTSSVGGLSQLSGRSGTRTPNRHFY